MIPHQDPGRYGPMGTPHAGRPERIAAYDRRWQRQCREAAAQHDTAHTEAAELGQLRREVRHLTDMLAEVRRDVRTIVSAEVSRLLATELPDAVRYLTGMEAPRNGRQ